MTWLPDPDTNGIHDMRRAVGVVTHHSGGATIYKHDGDANE